MRVQQLLILIAAGMLAACSDNSDLERRIQDVKNSPGEPVEPLPELIKPETFVYEAFNLRDPFTSAGDTAIPIALDNAPTDVIVPPQADPRRRREFLEGFELDSLTMVGTLNWENTLYGLVSDPDGLIHRIRVDEYAGKNNGQIFGIHDDRIELKEYVSDGQAWLENDAQLALEEG